MQALPVDQDAHFGEFAVDGRRQRRPAVGKDLRQKALYAVGFSLLGMLIYIWFRFKLQYGVGAIIANFHDASSRSASLSLTGREIDIPTIAALLTLVGYSVNDTVIIFDRIRETQKLERGKPLVDVMDDADQPHAVADRHHLGADRGSSCSRSSCSGAHVINTFAFTLLIGIVVGTYSSIYIASPIALAVSNWQDKRKTSRRRR